LTAERFINSPVTGARLYRTGDLVRYLADGRLEYIGRIDDQVKIRGFRIELGEIEGQLLRHPQVTGTVVLAREDEPGHKRLVAYVTVDELTANAAIDLRSHLQGALPDYMVPSQFVIMDALPVTANGKIDKKALPAPQASAQAAHDDAPRGDTEQRLAGIWASLLNLPLARIGANANFF
jgi:acyl-coenzyme A synthetase/AMP-(fatty) acid ligase